VRPNAKENGQVRLPARLPGAWNGGSSRHRAPVLQEGPKSDNICAALGFIWGIPAKEEEPTFGGYSIGKWSDTDGDGRYDTLEVETRNMKGPRAFDNSGIPLHKDNKTVVKERLFGDKTNPDAIYNEVTTFDNALTRPWTVIKKYLRVRNPTWPEDNCSESNNHVEIGGEGYFLSAEGLLMPTKKDQPPPDLRYFKQTKQ
jgi:hypothetical protein